MEKENKGKTKTGGVPKDESYVLAGNLLDFKEGGTWDQALAKRNAKEKERRMLAEEYNDRMGHGANPSYDDKQWAREARVTLDGLEVAIKGLDDALMISGLQRPNDPRAANFKRAALAYAHNGQALAEAEKDGKVMSANQVEDLSEGTIQAVRVFDLPDGCIIIHGNPDEKLVQQAPGGGGILDRWTPRADVTIDSASVGELLPTGASPNILERLVAYGNLGGLTSSMMTPNGNKILMPAVDDTAQKGRILSATARSQAGTDPTFAEVEMDAYVYTSDPVQVRQESLTDSPFGMAMLMDHLMATRIARIEAEHMTTGDGSGKPQGIIGIAQDYTLPDGQTPSLIDKFRAVDLSGVIGTLEPAYRKAGQYSSFTPNMGRVGWMIAHGAETVLRDMVDKDGRPLWLPNIREGEPMTIYGYPYHVNEEMDDPATGKISAIFGHFGYYMIRRVQGVVVRRWDDSQYGKDFRVAFQGFSRCDARAIGAWAGNTTTECKALIALKHSAT